MTRALDRQRIGAVALMTLLLSLGVLTSPALLDFFTPRQIAFAWLEHLAELAVIAVALLAAFTALDRVLPPGMPLRLALLSGALVVLSAALAVLLHAYYAQGFEHLPPPLRMLADSLRWGLPAVFLALIADVHQRALRADSAAHAAELARAQLAQGEGEQRLALLQAQIEPHFLFNMLANVRRLYRTRPQAGAEAFASLMRYLRTALPQLRSRRALLGEEMALVRAYLDLFQLRMGSQLAFSVEFDPALHEAEFPPTLLVTLVENAIKHGLEPAGGGRIEVRARRRGDLVEVAVLDDGAGFGSTATSGTGVGLVNIRRQLAARYAGRAQLRLEAREPKGACATLLVPLQAARRAPAGALATTGCADRAGPAIPPGAAAVAGLLAFAAPVTFFTGAITVMREPTLANVARAGLWWMLYGASLWLLLLVAGYAWERLAARLGRYLRGVLWLLAAGWAAGVASLLTAGRTPMLVEQGLVLNAGAAHLYAFTFSLVMSLLYVAHLRRSRAHQQAAARLAGAQAAQRHARQRLTQAREQEVQARIEPQFLFGMLERVQRLYERDTAGAEHLLDELIAFLRAALPRLRAASSSLLREVELARAFVRLHALAGTAGLEMQAAVAAPALHARFPPGALLPLLDGAVGGSGSCRLAATRSGERCEVLFALPAPPSGGSIARVRSLLDELYGPLAALRIDAGTGDTQVRLEVPYEPA